MVRTSVDVIVHIISTKYYSCGGGCLGYLFSSQKKARIFISFSSLIFSIFYFLEIDSRHWPLEIRFEGE